MMDVGHGFYFFLDIFPIRRGKYSPTPQSCFSRVAPRQTAPTFAALRLGRAIWLLGIVIIVLCLEVLSPVQKSISYIDTYSKLYGSYYNDLYRPQSEGYANIFETLFP